MHRDKDRYSKDHRYEVVLDNGDNPTRWSDLLGNVTTIASGSPHVTGARSTSFNKIAGVSADAYVIRSLGVRTGADLDPFSSEGQILSSVYLPSVTDVSSYNVALLMSSGTDNGIFYSVEDTDLAVGWNHIKFDCNSYTTYSGCGVDWKDVKYVAVGVSLDSASDTLSGVLIDSVRIQMPLAVVDFDPSIDNVTLQSEVQITDGTNTAAILDRTTGTEQPTDTDDALVVYDLSGGAASVSSIYRANSSGNCDGTVVYASATTLTITGTPFTINDEDLVYIKEVDATGNTANIWVNGTGGVQMEISAGTITRSGGSDFSANGFYEVGYNGQDKAYSAATDSDQVTVLNPEHEWFDLESVAEVTNEADASTDYYVAVDSYDSVAIQFAQTGGSDVIGLTVEASFRDDGTAASICEYVEVTENCEWFHATASGVVYGSGIIKVPFMAKYIKLTATKTGSNDDADYVIFASKY